MSAALLLCTFNQQQLCLVKQLGPVMVNKMHNMELILLTKMFIIILLELLSLPSQETKTAIFKIKNFTRVFAQQEFLLMQLNANLSNGGPVIEYFYHLQYNFLFF